MVDLNSFPSVVNTLGELSDINLQASNEAGQLRLSARSINDAQAAGLAAVNVTVGYVSGPDDPVDRTRTELDAWDAALETFSDQLMPVRDTAGFAAARTANKIGVIYGFQNAVQVGADLQHLDEFIGRGVRIVQLTYNDVNMFGAGSTAAENLGLTASGHELVAKLNDTDVMVDLSHSNRQTCLDAIAASTAPVSINHTGARALNDVPRNKTDEELRAVADSGGFVGIYFMPFLTADSHPGPMDVVRHIEHVLNVCGEDHVGIGSDGGTVAIDDYESYQDRLEREHEERRSRGIAAQGERPDAPPFVNGLTGPTQFARLVSMLADRGHSPQVIEKVFGGNFVRYAERVWT
jgi:membrane dipeptidase